MCSTTYRQVSTIFDNTPLGVLFTEPFHVLQAGYCVKLLSDLIQTTTQSIIFLLILLHSWHSFTVI